MRGRVAVHLNNQVSLRDHLQGLVSFWGVDLVTPLLYMCDPPAAKEYPSFHDDP